jgi:hypothetical protein
LADKSEPFDPNDGWAKNYRTFRWQNAILPALSPLALLGIFLVGYLTFGLGALTFAGFAWFDYAKNAKSAAKAWTWRILALIAAPWGIYMSLLQFIPSWR